MDTLKQFLFQEKSPHVQKLVYLFSGLTVAAVQFVAFAAGMAALNEHYLLASTIAFCVAVVTSFTLQRFVTFAKTAARERATHHSLILFLANSGFSLLLNSLFMYTGVELLLLNSFVAQIISMAILAVYNFAAYRFIFK